MRPFCVLHCSAVQPQHTKSDAEKSWEVRVENGKVLVTGETFRTPPSEYPLNICCPVCLLISLQPQRTKSDADDSWEVKAEKGKVEAPAAGSSGAAAAGTPFAGATMAADGRVRYTADFMKTLRGANAQHPGDLKPGEWEGNPPTEMPNAAGGFGGPGGQFDRGMTRK